MYIRYIFSSSFFSFHYLFCYLLLRWQRFSCLSFFFPNESGAKHINAMRCCCCMATQFFSFLIFLCIILAADGRIYSVMRRQCIRCGNPIWRDAPVLHFLLCNSACILPSLSILSLYTVGWFPVIGKRLSHFPHLLLCSLGWILERTLRTNPPPPPGCL